MEKLDLPLAISILQRFSDSSRMEKSRNCLNRIEESLREGEGVNADDLETMNDWMIVEIPFFLGL